MFKVLVVDDETIARNIVIILLEQRNDIAGVDQARDGSEAIKLLNENTYDIVFLDIQMPGNTGLEVAKFVSENCAVIFVTAYHEYALQAFDLHAVDYLLKPFDDERFAMGVERAIARVKNKVLANNHALFETLSRMFQASSSPLNGEGQFHSNKLMLKEIGKIKLLDFSDIKYVKGAGNYVEIVLVDGKTLLQRETLRSIEAKLRPDLFTRIHKSSIVRNDLIKELRPTPKGDYVVQLSSGEELMMSRRNKDKLKAWIG